VFRAGWDAGFQEALQPDRYPHQNRCEMAYQVWLKEPPEPPGEDFSEAVNFVRPKTKAQG